jgi:hypothetical protein
LVEHDVRVIDKALRVRAARLGSAAMGARLGGLIYGTLVVLAVVISGSLQSMSRRRAAPGAKGFCGRRRTRSTIERRARPSRRRSASAFAPFVEVPAVEAASAQAVRRWVRIDPR